MDLHVLELALVKLFARTQPQNALQQVAQLVMPPILPFAAMVLALKSLTLIVNYSLVAPLLALPLVRVTTIAVLMPIVQPLNVWQRRPQDNLAQPTINVLLPIVWMECVVIENAIPNAKHVPETWEPLKMELAPLLVEHHEKEELNVHQTVLHVVARVMVH